MTLALLLVLAQPYPTSFTAKQGVSHDGGSSWSVDCVNCTTMPDGGAPASDATLALLALELVNGSARLRVINLPPAPARNPLTGAAKVEVGGLPLPAGAAQENGGNLAAILVALGLDGGVAATEALIASELRDGMAQVRVSNLPPAPAKNPLTGAAKVDGSGAVQPVSAAALPLPAGAATDAAVAAIVAQLAQLNALSTQPWPTQPINPFVPRCNLVRRTNCQP